MLRCYKQLQVNQSPLSHVWRLLLLGSWTTGAITEVNPNLWPPPLRASSSHGDSWQGEPWYVASLSAAPLNGLQLSNTFFLEERDCPPLTGPQATSMSLAPDQSTVQRRAVLLVQPDKPPPAMLLIRDSHFRHIRSKTSAKSFQAGAKVVDIVQIIPALVCKLP